MRHISFLTIILACLVLAAPSPGRANDDGFFGIWDVNTRLVTASGPVNPDYKPGDLRVDVWRIDGATGQPMLTTRDGTIPGRIGNGQAGFFAEVPIGQIIVMRLTIGAFLTSGRSMKGTINAEYWDRRFAQKVGLDAWTFEAMRR